MQHAVVSYAVAVAVWHGSLVSRQNDQPHESTVPRVRFDCRVDDGGGRRLDGRMGSREILSRLLTHGRRSMEMEVGNREAKMIANLP